MKVELTKTTRGLANGAATDDSRPVITGVLVSKDKAVVADGFLLVIKALQPPKMDFDQTSDDKIQEAIIPADALKACKGDITKLQTIEAVRMLPSAELLKADATVTTTKIVVRMDGDDFSVEADTIEGNYPKYSELFPALPLRGQVAINTKLLKKLLKTLPDESILKLRIGEPENPVEFQCTDPDGEIPIRGIVMPMRVMWDVPWLCQLPA